MPSLVWGGMPEDSNEEMKRNTNGLKEKGKKSNNATIHDKEKQILSL